VKPRPSRDKRPWWKRR